MQSQAEIRAKIAQNMIAHPRVLHQRLLRNGKDAERIVSVLPQLIPFKEHSYHDFVPILDWDHRLPSKDLMLRLYAYYSAESAAVGRADQEARAAEIARLDKYPEFDIPDFADLVADEAYEIQLHLDGTYVAGRLTSAWRRELDSKDASRAIQVVRSSREFEEINAKVPNRPESLGDAEATSWTPPCESNYQSWTLDVWYLLTYDGMFGQGRSFLVDIEESRVVSVREFTLRPG